MAKNLYLTVAAVLLPLFPALSQDAPANLKILKGHTETVYQAVFSPDGKILASTSFDKTVKLWNTSDGSLITTLTGHAGKVICVAFSPDSRTLVSGSDDKTLKLWAAPGAAADTLAGHGSPVRALAVSPDGSLLFSAGDDKTVRVWNRATGKAEFEIAPFAAKALALAVSPGNTRLAVGCEDQTIHVIALQAPAPQAAPGASAEIVKAGESWRYFKGNAVPPADWAKPGFDESKWMAGESGFGYSSAPDELKTVKTQLPDMASGYLTLFIRKGFKIADPKKVDKLSLRVTCDDGFVAYLNGAEVGRSNVEGNPATNATAAATSKEATEETVDLTPHIGKLVAGDNVLALSGHNSALTSSDFVLTPVLSGAIKAEEPKPDAGAKPGSRVLAIEGIGEPVAAVAWSPDNARIASAGASGTIRIHVVENKSEALKIPGPGGAVKGIAFIDGSVLASANADGKIRLWSTADGKESAALAGHAGPVASLALSPDRKTLASGGEDKTLRIWNVAEKKEVRNLAGHEGPVLAVAFSPDGKLVVSGSADKTLRIWNAETGAPAGNFANPAEVLAVAAGDGKYFAGGSWNDLRVSRSSPAEAIKSFSGHENLIHYVAFSPDGQLIASAAADKTVRIWNVAEGKQVRSIAAHEQSVYCVDFSPNGQMLASGGYDKLVKLWNVADGAEIKKLAGHEEGVFALAFTADGKSVISGSSDNTLRRWNIEDGKAQIWSEHKHWIMDLKIFKGQPRMLSVDYQGNLLLWDLDQGKTIAKKKVASIPHGLGLSPDGKQAATANFDGTIFLFDI